MKRDRTISEQSRRKWVRENDYDFVHAVALDQLSISDLATSAYSIKLYHIRHKPQTHPCVGKHQLLAPAQAASRNFNHDEISSRT
jgi:hypothetical protein